VQEAAWRGGLLSNGRTARGSGDGVAVQLAPTLRPHRSNANQHLVDYPLSLGIGRFGHSLPAANAGLLIAGHYCTPVSRASIASGSEQIFNARLGRLRVLYRDLQRSVCCAFNRTAR
jgi:hypothetical protein